MVKYPRLAVSQEQLTQDIQEGDYLLLLPCAQALETIWIQVVTILKRGYYEGIVFNKIALFGQVIRCHQRHIQQCVRGQGDQTDANIRECHQALVDE